MWTGVTRYGPVPGKSEHLRTQCCQHDRRPDAVRSEVGRRVERIEVVAHGLDRRQVGLLAVPLDQRLVTDSQPGHEPPRGERLEETDRTVGRHGPSAVDVGDPGADHQAPRGSQQGLGRRERLASVCLAVPEGPVAELVNFGCGLLGLGARKGLEGSGPQAGAVGAEGVGGGHGAHCRADGASLTWLANLVRNERSGTDPDPGTDELLGAH